MSLYADDLLYVSDPIASIPRILYVLERFGSFSGYKINVLKSECYPVNSLALALPQSDIPSLKFRTSGFKYLGINLTCTLPSLYCSDFSPMVAQDRFSKVELSTFILDW